jgi:hypothetical protein
MFDIKWCDNITILNDFMKLLDITVEYCGISNQDDFHNYETIIPFKYKIINTNPQISKLCEFITSKKSELDYDWYMKFRPDIKLLEQINFKMLSEHAINARARVYFGPKRIKYGMSVNGRGCWANIGDCAFAHNEYLTILDDQLFIFHKNTVQLGAFHTFDTLDAITGWWGAREIEPAQTKLFTDRKIPLNIIGINVENTKYRATSGDLNMK